MASSSRCAVWITMPDGVVYVVSEGDGEPRSTGSVAVRLYSGANPDYPLDQFLCGLILEPRRTRAIFPSALRQIPKIGQIAIHLDEIAHFGA